MQNFTPIEIVEIPSWAYSNNENGELTRLQHENQMIDLRLDAKGRGRWWLINENGERKCKSLQEAQAKAIANLPSTPWIELVAAHLEGDGVCLARTIDVLRRVAARSRNTPELLHAFQCAQAIRVPAVSHVFWDLAHNPIADQKMKSAAMKWYEDSFSF